MGPKKGRDHNLETLAYRGDIGSYCGHVGLYRAYIGLCMGIYTDHRGKKLGDMGSIAFSGIV